MKKFLKNISDQRDTAVTRARTAVQAKRAAVTRKLAEDNGQFVMDHAAVFVIIIVLAGIAIVLLTSFMQNDMAPTLKQKILDFFN